MGTLAFLIHSLFISCFSFCYPVCLLVGEGLSEGHRETVPSTRSGCSYAQHDLACWPEPGRRLGPSVRLSPPVGWPLLCCKWTGCREARLGLSVYAWICLRPVVSRYQPSATVSPLQRALPVRWIGPAFPSAGSRFQSSVSMKWNRTGTPCSPT